jgi:tetratricopeptide (TPR) repeat protein
MEPLELPERSQHTSVATVATSPAVALFVTRAQTIVPGFSLTDTNAAVIAEICCRLDGLPLALELAAARVKLLSPSALLARLEQRLPLLTGGPRDAPARQQTLRNTIDWSYQLLPRGEQTLFRRLGVFVGGWTLDAAAAACDVDGDLRQDVLNELQSLVDQSLLKRVEDADGEPRFAMLETIREYALERLVASGEADSIRRRHAEHFLALAESAEPRQRGAMLSPASQARLELEHDNLRAVCTWSLIGHGDSEIGLRVAGALWLFWWMRGHYQEGSRWLDIALEQSRGTATSIRAKLLGGAGSIAAFHGEHVQATPLLEEALTLYKNLGVAEGIAEMLLELGRLARDQGDYTRAATLEEESLALFQAHGIGWGIIWALLSLGDVALDQGDTTRAARRFQEVLARSQALGDQRDSGWALCNLGRIAFAQGNVAQAQTLFEESLALFQGIGFSAAAAQALVELGRAAQWQGDMTQAAAYFTESLTLERNIGSTDTIFDDLTGLAGVAGAQRLPARAARLFGAVEALRESAGHPLPPVERANYERDIAAARAQLDEDAWIVAWAEGQAMTVEQAIAEALASAA